MRAALYARYSNEKQNERSADDQLAVCRAYALAKGWTVVVELKDEAISGALMVNRPAVNALMAMADAGGFDVLLTEDEDRVARNLEHQAHVYNRLQAAGIAWATLYTERVELMHVAFKGMLAQQYLVDLSRKTKRGVRANAEKGMATGGRLFGYATQPGGAISIVAAEAQVVAEIFTSYAAGVSAQGIAADLNRRGVSGARGGQWTTAQISGSRQRANGVLQTELYAGVKVWNRMEVKKDQLTGKRLPVMKPAAEWRRTEVPHLAIVTPALWAAVQARKTAGRAHQPQTIERRRVGVFSGLVRCGHCDGPYTVIRNNRLGCSAHWAKGAVACSNNRTVSRRQVEQRLLHGLKTNLMTPTAIQLYVEAYHKRWQERRRAAVRAEGSIRTRLGEASRRISRLLDGIEYGTMSPAEAKDRMASAVADRDRLTAELAAIDEAEPAIELHPHAAGEYARQVDQLQQRLAQCSDLTATGADQLLVKSIRDLVEKVVLRPKADFAGAPYDLEIHGRLGLLLGGATNPPPYREGLVAGGSYTLPPNVGPQTFRLVA